MNNNLDLGDLCIALEKYGVRIYAGHDYGDKPGYDKAAGCFGLFVIRCEHKQQRCTLSTCTENYFIPYKDEIEQLKVLLDQYEQKH